MTSEKRILITGATGFIGEPLVKFLSSFEKFQILALGRNFEKLNLAFNSLKNVSIALSENFEMIHKFSPHVIIHLASFNSSKEDENSVVDLLKSNIEYGVILLNHLEKCKDLNLIIYPGSFSEYNSVTGEISLAYLYSATKKAFIPFLEYYSDKYGFKFIHPILYSVYGGNKTVKRIIDYIIESLDSSSPIKMTAGEQRLDFIHVDDVSWCFYKIIENQSNLLNGETIFVGTGTSYSIKQLVKIIKKITGKKCNIAWGAIPYRNRDIMYACAPIQKNSKNLKWYPAIPLNMGIKKLFNV